MSTSGQLSAIIRPAAPEDAAGIAAVHVSSWLATYSHLPRTKEAAETGLARRAALWTHRLAGSDTGCSTFVATDGDHVCGFVYVGPTPDPDDDPSRVGQVLSIHVDPAVAGRGIGTHLMARAVSSFRAAGNVAATLWVVADNRRARRFYERLGWHVDGAQQRELLALPGEEGDEVEVLRYRMDLDPDAVGRT